MDLLLTVCLSLCVGAENGQPPGQAAGVPTRRVTISVVDAETGKPVQVFAYRWRTDTPDGRGNRVQKEWKTLRAPRNTFEVDAPINGELSVFTKSADYIHEYGEVFGRRFAVRSDENVRQFTVKMGRGIAVRGVVKDAQTRMPVAGATVAPLEFYNPSCVPDFDRAVKTDAKGAFELPLVEPGQEIRAMHPHYLDEDAAAKEQPVEMLLRAGATISGTVKDARGNPLAGVSVSEGGKSTLSGKDGRFVLRGLSGWMGYYPTFRKKGYLEKTLKFKEPPTDPLSVVIQPDFGIAGRVLSPEGEPVPRYAVAVGAGTVPRDYSCVTSRVEDLQGQFDLRLQTGGKHWVGIRADGYAPWEGWTHVGRDGRPLTIRLRRGVTVTGKVTAPANGTTVLRAVLVPQRKADVDAEGRPSFSRNGPGEAALRAVIGELSDVRYWNPSEIATHIATVEEDGAFRIEQVRPDSYTLTMAGKGVAPTTIRLEVPEGGIDVGRLKAGGTGRIFGRVYKPKFYDEGGVWAFKQGEIHHPDCDDILDIRFKTDEDGRFSVEGVPVGFVSVSFDYPEGSDIVYSFSRSVRVLEGKSTEVRFGDPAGDWNLPLDVVIGDGSARQLRVGGGLGPNPWERPFPQAALPPADLVRKAVLVSLQTGRPEKLRFVVQLEPLGDGPMSGPMTDEYGVEATLPLQVVVPDLHPGKYRLRVWDGAGDQSPAFETEVESRGRTDGARAESDSGNLPVRVFLGAGSALLRMKQWDTMPETWIEFFAAAEDGKSPPRGRTCHSTRSCRIRYLHTGKHTFYAVDEQGQWCRVKGVDVRDDRVTQLELPGLSPGAKITGKIRFHSERRRPTSLVAADAHGILRETPGFAGVNGEEFSINGLWPGTWKLTVYAGKETLATTEVHIRETETVHRDLVGK